MTWQPDQGDLSRLVELLTDSTRGDSAVQQRVMQQLSLFSTNPDFNSYLAYVFSNTTTSVSVRMVSGLTLKNNVSKSRGNLPPGVLQYIQQCVLQGLSDTEPAIRSTAGSIVSTFANISLQLWPDVVPRLLSLLDHGNAVQGAFAALQKVCEDCAEDLESGDPSILQLLITRLLLHINNPDSHLRAISLQCINQFILFKPVVLLDSIESFIASLYRLTGDTSPLVRRAVCQAIVMLFEATPEHLLGELPNIVNFMLYCAQDSDDSVALEASEFWLTFAEQELLRDHLEPYLPQIIPVLLKRMVYSDDEVAALSGGDDSHVPDNEGDIKPRHHKAKTHSNSQPTHDDDDDDGSDDGSDDDDDTDDIEWTIRKCSAASLDSLATVFRNSVLTSLLPVVKDQLSHQDWRVREAGILALGAIAEGTQSGMAAHLPSLVPHLINSLNDTKPLVRSICCWTLGRYSQWIVYGDYGVTRFTQLDPVERQSHLKTYMEPLLTGLLRMALDNNKRVQEAGCSALAALEEVACDQLIPYLVPILQTVAIAFSKYQHKNLLILYDALSTLADVVGSALNHPDLVALFMPRLMEKWASVADDDVNLFPLFECLSSIAISVGPGFAPFSAGAWERCLRIIGSSLIAYDAYLQNPEEVDEPEKDFMVVALDLLSGIVQGLGPLSAQLIASGQPGILDYLPLCLNHRICEVRQSAFALLGDFAINAFESIRPRIQQLLQLCTIHMTIPHMDEQVTAVSNNATWATGEIAVQLKQDILPYVPTLLNQLVPILVNQHSVKQTLRENAAITVGRLGLYCAEAVAPHLHHFAGIWCVVLRDSRDNSEKESAYTGFCRIVLANPSGLVKDLLLFCEAVVRWKVVSGELNEGFRRVLEGFCRGMGGEWERVLGGLSAESRRLIRERYQL